MAKGFAAFLQRIVTPGEPGNDRAVRERKLSFPGSPDRKVVTQNCAQVVEIALFVGHGDQFPVTISGGNFYTEDWRCFVFGMPGRERQGRKNGQRDRDCEYQHREPFHWCVLSCFASDASGMSQPIKLWRRRRWLGQRPAALLAAGYDRRRQ